MAWATVADVNTLLGVVVDAPTVSLAARTIELKTGLIEAVERVDMTDRDRYWLKLAVCYQAAWLPTQADYLERTKVTSAAQDGQSANYAPDALELAPLARTALKRLSFAGSRSVTPQGAGHIGRIDPLAEADDDFFEWTPENVT